MLKTTSKVLELKHLPLRGKKELAPLAETEGELQGCPRDWGGLNDVCYFCQRDSAEALFQGKAGGKMMFVQILGQ